MKQATTAVMMMMLIAAVMLLLPIITTAYAQTTTTPLTPASELYISEEDGFSLQVPRGWVIEDYDNIPLELNNEGLATLCLENEALPAVGGEYNCQDANVSDAIYIDRWPEFAISTRI
jgi:hypothetical protein